MIPPLKALRQPTTCEPVIVSILPSVKFSLDTIGSFGDPAARAALPEKSQRPDTSKQVGNDTRARINHRFVRSVPATSPDSKEK